MAPDGEPDAHLVAIADENRKNPVMNWIRLRVMGRDCRADGTLTLAEWFDRMKRLLATRWLISAVAACVADAFKTGASSCCKGAQAIEDKLACVPGLSSPGGFWTGWRWTRRTAWKRVISHWIIELGS